MVEKVREFIKELMKYGYSSSQVNLLRFAYNEDTANRDAEAVKNIYIAAQTIRSIAKSTSNEMPEWIEKAVRYILTHKRLLDELSVYLEDLAYALVNTEFEPQVTGTDNVEHALRSYMTGGLPELHDVLTEIMKTPRYKTGKLKDNQHILDLLLELEFNDEDCSLYEETLHQLERGELTEAILRRQ